jgi:hypothetical protein
VTHAALLALALLPTVPVPPVKGVAWAKRCEQCPQRFVDECHALMEGGHMIRCYDKTPEEIERLKEALRWQN